MTVHHSVRSVRAAAALVLLAPALMLLAPAGVQADPLCETVGTTVTCTFDYTGATQTWTVPAGVTSATFDLYGASGGDDPNSSPGGDGSHVHAVLDVASGTSYDVEVGQMGASRAAKPLAYNGGGAGGTADKDSPSDRPAQGGGGATDIRMSTGRLLVAGGGGGAAYSSPASAFWRVNGGVGGDSGSAGGNGSLGPPNAPGAEGGGPGTDTAPGSGGAGTQSVDGGDGSGPSGGTGGSGKQVIGFAGPGGGGGGGYFGGGGGGWGGATEQSVLTTTGGGGGGGGGGSSFVTPSATSSQPVEEGVRDGNGQAVVTYTLPTTDTTIPSVTITQGSGQGDPTSTSPIVFDVVFSEGVTGFGNDDISLTGTAGATTANVSGTAGGTTYTVSVSGMTGSGTVIAAVKAGAATDGTNNSAASPDSTDHTVTYNAPDTTVPSVTIAQGSGQADPTSTSPIVFDAVFSESVSGFGDDDIDLTGTAGATTAQVSGSGTTYTVSVSGMTTSGTVIVKVKAGAASDGTNPSTASGTASVTYEKPASEFDLGPTATIIGTPQVGQTLTAGEGTPSPTPDSFAYQWFADGTEISNVSSSAIGQEKTLLLTEAEQGTAITVQVTAIKSGFTDASDTSDPTNLVAPTDTDGDGDGDGGGDGDGDADGGGDGDGDEESDDGDDDGGTLPGTGAPLDESVLLAGLALLVGGMVVMNSTHLSSQTSKSA